MSERWQPVATLEVLRLRATLLAAVRGFFAARGVLEVETPVLARAAVTDPQLHSLATEFSAPAARYYLQTSPEFAMKRLLAAGSGDIYQLGRAFRDAEQGRWHNGEFTLLEWYRTGYDHLALMDEVEALLTQLLRSRLAAPAERLSYREAFRRALAIDPLTASDAELLALAAARAGIDPRSLAGDRDACLDLLMAAAVAPTLGRARLTFVDAYPASQAALARLLPGTPATAARFEGYLEGVELCNGFQELGDPLEQRRRFEADLARRAARRLPLPPIDERLLAALAAGLPDCAGVALGFDRLVMLAAGVPTLAEVLAFPLDSA